LFSNKLIELSIDLDLVNLKTSLKDSVFSLFKHQRLPLTPKSTFLIE